MVLLLKVFSDLLFWFSDCDSVSSRFLRFGLSETRIFIQYITKTLLLFSSLRHVFDLLEHEFGFCWWLLNLFIFSWFRNTLRVLKLGFESFLCAFNWLCLYSDRIDIKISGRHRVNTLIFLEPFSCLKSRLFLFFYLCKIRRIYHVKIGTRLFHHSTIWNSTLLLNLFQIFLN